VQRLCWLCWSAPHTPSHPKIGKQAVPQQKPPTSCDDKGAAQPSDVAKPARGAESASAPTNDPCPTKSPDSHKTAPVTPPPGARN